MDFTLDSLNEFIKEYQHRFIRFAANYINDNFIAEDIFMESVMTLWRNKSRLPSDTNIPAYTLKVLKNRCIDHLRHKMVTENFKKKELDNQAWDIKVKISSLENLEPDDIFSKEIIQIVAKTVKAMPEQTKSVFIMSRRDGKQNKEIAKEIGISEKGVEYHITKANKLLREALRDYLTVFVILFYLL